jgi:hypothetical protein
MIIPNFIHKVLLIVCLFGTVGFSFGFMKWFNWDGNTLANLPVFPNILDSMFLIFSVCYLSYRVISLELKKC